MYKCALLKLLANVALLTLLFSQSETNTVISNSFLSVRLSNMGSRDASTWLQCVGPTLHCWGAWVILEWQMSFLKISCRMGMVHGHLMKCSKAKIFFEVVWVVCLQISPEMVVCLRGCVNSQFSTVHWSLYRKQCSFCGVQISPGVMAMVEPSSMAAT